MIVFLELEPLDTVAIAALEDAYIATADGTTHTYVDGKYRIFSFYDPEDELAFTLKHGSMFVEASMYFTVDAGFFYCPYIPLLHPPT